jgi:hypothetical protein
MNRRSFLQSSAAVAGALSLAANSAKSAPGPNDKINVCITGVRGRGGSLLETFAAIPEVTVKYVCDLDAQVCSFTKHVDVDDLLATIAAGARP